MIAKILGVLDILCGVMLIIFFLFSFFPSQLMIIMGLYLGAKGSFFLISKDVASMFDIICALIIFAMIAYPMPYFVVMLCSLFLFQKGAFSLLS